MSVQCGVIQLVKHSTVNHLFLPPDGDGTCAELLEKLLILIIKHDVLGLGGVGEFLYVLGVDHIGLWHPGGLHQPRLQTMEIDILEKGMASWVITTTGTKERQKTGDV